MTQAKVAAAVGLVPSYYWRVEAGRLIPRLALCRAIAKTLGTTLDELWPEGPQGEAQDVGDDEGQRRLPEDSPAL